MSLAGYETRAGRSTASPVRHEHKSFTLRNVTKSVSNSWAAQCTAASGELERIQGDIAAVKIMTTSFADEKRTLCNDLKQLLATVREATTICRVVQGMEVRAPQLTTLQNDFDTDHRIDISISPRPADVAHNVLSFDTRNTALHNALQSVVPSASYASPQPRAPATSARALPAAPDMSEDDLVVLLLKRQLQRRELELKSLLQNQ
jgi:hypothetical protein